MAKERRPGPEKRKRKPTDPGEPGTDTSADTRLVNAQESDPGYYKDPLIGKTVGKCKIRKFLGEGRTAIVYEAVYEPLNRTVALKVLQSHMTRYPAVVRVFQQEGRAVAALDHENVVKIYDVGEDGGHHYLVLELLKGETLLRKIDDVEDGGLPLDEALNYVRQAAAGLAAAQRKNLIHRDIKPQNLVIEPDGTLKIVDFGLAAEAEGAFAGGRLGTPHYMAPEICRGEMASPSSDIYALGITLFHALVGHPPYYGRTTTEEIVQEHLKGERLQPEKLRPDLPKQVCDLLRKMTRSEAGQRPSAKDVAEFIATRLSPEKLGARQHLQSARMRGRRRQKAGPGPALIAGACVMLLVCGGIVLLKGGSEEGGEGGQQAQQPAPVPKPDPTPPPKPEPDKGTEIEDKDLDREIRDLMDMAKREERTGNITEAHVLFMRVIARAPTDSRYAREAKAAAEMLSARLTGDKTPSGRTYIGVKASEEAGRQFEEAKPRLREKLQVFDIAGVKAEVEELMGRTREGTAERVLMEDYLRRVGYMESLISIMTSRVPSIPVAKAEWARRRRRS